MPVDNSENAIPVIMNSHAGSLHAPVGAEQLRRMAREVGFTIDVIQTHSIDEMRSQIKRLVGEKRQKIGVAGGDGTVEAAIQEVAKSDSALGILSQGTFNNFATCLRLPHNLPGALNTLNTGTIVAVDLGRIEGKGYLTESAGIGLFADGLAIYGHGGSKKNVLRGLYTAARLALSMRPRHMRITIDGEVREEAVVLCEIANTYRIAQAIPIAPYAVLDDGELDVIIVGAIARRQVPAYYRAIRAQMHIDLPKVTMLRAKHEVRIETRQPRNVHRDDEIIGTTPVTVTMERAALKVVSPGKP
jgi:diacylglycerol kinase (ATP)